MADVVAQEKTTFQKMTQNSKFNWDIVKRDITLALTGALDDLVDSGGQLANYALELADLTVYALRVDDESMLREIRANVELLAERHRVRAVNTEWLAIQQVLEIVQSIGRTFITAAIVAL